MTTLDTSWSDEARRRCDRIVRFLLNAISPEALLAAALKNPHAVPAISVVSPTMPELEAIIIENRLSLYIGDAQTPDDFAWSIVLRRLPEQMATITLGLRGLV